MEVIVRQAMMNVIKPKIVFVLGCPGSGKGTLCGTLARKFNYRHLSAGELLRKEKVKVGSKYATTIDEHFRKGVMVPAEITATLLIRAIEKDPQVELFLIDGYPVTKDNFDYWNKMMASRVDLVGVLYLTAGEEVCRERILQRGASGSGREDDNEEVIRRRFRTYGMESMPLITIYQKQGLVKEVDSRKPLEALLKDVEEILQELLNTHSTILEKEM
uniref:Adenylate kinase n=1 Tax=Timema monikensis TaxID=170555 RepID=A0A7R9EHT5_9NEOP|nr:unnamed protein product [Timema monikensis]